MPSTYLRATDLVSAEVDGELVMMSLERGNYYGIGGVGTWIWELLSSPVSLDDIVESVCARFAVDEATCRGDTLRLLTELTTHGLVSTS